MERNVEESILNYCPGIVLEADGLSLGSYQMPPKSEGNTLLVLNTRFLDCPSSSILEKTAFRKRDLFQSSGEGGRHLLCWVP
jgi:hypothetical protein